MTCARRALLVAGVLALALTIRFESITNPPLDFHPTRQYRSAIIARAFYYEHSPDVSAEALSRAREQAASQGVNEPPIMERLVATAWWLAGKEHLWAARFLAAAFWIAGAWPLYVLARGLAGPTGAIAAVVFFLFVPFGVVASTSFQPESLMVAATVGVWLTAARYAEQPTRRRLVVAIAAAATATLVKPFAVFLTVTAHTGATIGRRGWRGLLDRDFQVLIFLSTLPMVLFYGYELFFSEVLRWQLSHPTRFLPHIILTDFFWQGWLGQMRVVVGLPALLAAIVGVALAPSRQSRWLLIGLWVGYIIFGFVVHYHIATHDYYSLPLIPLVALSMSPLFERLYSMIGTWTTPRWQTAAASAALLTAGVWGGQRAHRESHRPLLRIDVRKYERIGRHVRHAPRTIVLDAYYGAPLVYHGNVSGPSWPTGAELTLHRLAGTSSTAAEQRLDSLIRDGGTHFIVIDMGSYRAQPDLQNILENRFVRVANDYNYAIFDLRAHR